MMEENPELKMVKSMLRSLLLSCKEGVPAAILQRDYKEIVGEFLPFRKLGFPTLEDFILSVPDVVNVSRKGNEYIFHAVADESTAHIQKMVSKQRSKKVKKPIRRPRGGGKTGPHFLARPQPPIPHPRTSFHQAPPRSLARGHRGARHGMPSFMPQLHNAFTPVMVHLSTGRGRMITLGPNRSPVKEEFVERQQSKFEAPPRFRRQKYPSGPTSQSAPAARKALSTTLQHVDNATQYLQQLRAYLAEQNIQANFETVPAQGGYASSIVINKRVFGSEGIFESASEAEAAVAMNVLKFVDLQEQTTDCSMPVIDWDNPSKKDDPTSLTPQEINKIKTRVKEILVNKKNGLWATRIPFEYKERYDVEPPSDLSTLLKQWTDICKVEVAPNTDMEIVYPPDEKSGSKDVTVPREILLKSDVEAVVYVTYINNPGYFCVQREDSVIDSISGELERHCKASSPPNPRLIEKGQFCAGMYSGDGNWTRAQVLQLDTQGKAELLFIDFGNVEWVNVDSIRWLSQDLASFTAQAINCSLAGIMPLETETEWSNGASKELATVVADQALVAIPRCFYDNIVDVELYLKSDRSVSLNDRLIQKGLVRSVEKEEEKLHPVELQLPEDSNWDVHITYISTSTESVMMRIVGEEYSDRLDHFMQQLETAFKNSSSEAPIVEGLTYVAYDDGLYHRVRVILEDEKKVHCYFLDHGDTDTLLPMQLQPLDPEINCKLPYQAIEVRMYGLENVCTNITALEKMCDLAMGRTCIAEVVDREDIPSVILFDTSGDTDVNINETILKTIEEEGGGIDSPRTSSPAPNSSASSTPRVLSPVPSGLTKGGDSGGNTDSGLSPLSSKEDISAEKSYLSTNVQCNGDARTNQITGSSPSSYLPPPPPVDQSDSSFEQADKSKTDTSLTETLKELNLDAEAGAQHSNSIVKNSDVLVKQEPIPNRLQPYAVPPVGEYLDVHVISVSDPHNFICIPYEEMNKFDALLKKMLEYYTKNIDILGEEDIVLGEIYAGREDDLWLRVRVTQLTAPGRFAVHQVDLGVFTVLEASELQPLNSVFLQLPIMAFQAKLGSLIPTDSNWSEASKYKLLELALNKDLVGLVQGCDAAKGVVDLRLIDTSNENYDICIDEALITLGYARLSDS